MKMNGIDSIFAANVNTFLFDSFWGCIHNSLYGTPAEDQEVRERTRGLHGWRQNIFLSQVVWFPHWEKA
jgi:hypothetical protein